MWTMSNSLVDSVGLLAASLLLAACTMHRAPLIAPEAPRERATLVEAPSGGVASRPTAVEPAEIASAEIRRAADDPKLLAILSRGVKRAAAMFIIDVRTDRPLGDLQRSALPVIVLNGQPLTNTYAIDVQHLAALVPPDRLRSENSIAVEFLGDEVNTRARKAVAVHVRH
jgi:hypothetical protein